MCQLLGGKSQYRGRRYELNDFYVAVQVPRSSLGIHTHTHTLQPAVGQVRIFKGRNQIHLFLVSPAGMGSCGTAAMSSCSGQICHSFSHSSSSSLGRRGWAKPPCKRQCKREMNLMVPCTGKGEKECSEPEISGDFWGTAMVPGLPWRKHYFFLADSPQGFELNQFPWFMNFMNLDAAENTWAMCQRLVCSFSCSCSHFTGCRIP